ncbi:hypothetical protein Val02_76510 [Virgisporangium aliadipatigenens]|uniref:Uncharacterized protein n=1 Tax=Virgisporangium aliadipatigenens TaxID=741659 RepID=A0A8J3YVW1_9ACTN|nr:hypothetical protein Val02_76510 [Virgisporangium aliadipatigenens]
MSGAASSRGVRVGNGSVTDDGTAGVSDSGRGVGCGPGGPGSLGLLVRLARGTGVSARARPDSPGGCEGSLCEVTV